MLKFLVRQDSNGYKSSEGGHQVLCDLSWQHTQDEFLLHLQQFYAGVTPGRLFPAYFTVTTQIEDQLFYWIVPDQTTSNLHSLCSGLKDCKMAKIVENQPQWVK